MKEIYKWIISSIIGVIILGICLLIGLNVSISPDTVVLITKIFTVCCFGIVFIISLRFIIFDR